MAELLLDFTLEELDPVDEFVESSLLLRMTLEEDSDVTLDEDFALLLDTIVELELDWTELDELETEELDFCSELELASLLEDATELLNAWQAG